jgi:hypothetical protein
MVVNTRPPNVNEVHSTRLRTGLLVPFDELMTGSFYEKK